MARDYIAIVGDSLFRVARSPARPATRWIRQTFLDLWKDADPDVPLVKEAKAESAKLLRAGHPQ
jgi:hypothetical protein